MLIWHKGDEARPKCRRCYTRNLTCTRPAKKTVFRNASTAPFNNDQRWVSGEIKECEFSARLWLACFELRLTPLQFALMLEVLRPISHSVRVPSWVRLQWPAVKRRRIARRLLYRITHCLTPSPRDHLSMLKMRLAVLMDTGIGHGKEQTQTRPAQPLAPIFPLAIQTYLHSPMDKPTTGSTNRLFLPTLTSRGRGLENPPCFPCKIPRRLVC